MPYCAHSYLGRSSPPLRENLWLNARQFIYKKEWSWDSSSARLGTKLNSFRNWYFPVLNFSQCTRDYLHRERMPRLPNCLHDIPQKNIFDLTINFLFFTNAILGWYIKGGINVIHSTLSMRIQRSLCYRTNGALEGDSHPVLGSTTQGWLSQKKVVDRLSSPPTHFSLEVSHTLTNGAIDLESFIASGTSDHPWDFFVLTKPDSRSVLLHFWLFSLPSDACLEFFIVLYPVLSNVIKNFPVKFRKFEFRPKF